MVARAEVFGDYHPRAHCRARKKADQQKYQRARSRDRRKGSVVEKNADYQRVGGVVKLLEKFAYKDGKREPEHVQIYVPRGHVARCGTGFNHCIRR